MMLSDEDVAGDERGEENEEEEEDEASAVAAANMDANAEEDEGIFPKPTAAGARESGSVAASSSSPDATARRVAASMWALVVTSSDRFLRDGWVEELDLAGAACASRRPRPRECAAVAVPAPRVNLLVVDNGTADGTTDRANDIVQPPSTPCIFYADSYLPSVVGRRSFVSVMSTGSRRAPHGFTARYDTMRSDTPYAECQSHATPPKRGPPRAVTWAVYYVGARDV